MEPAKLKDYFEAARLDHWVKQLFVLPGIVLAWILSRSHSAPFQHLILPIILGLIATSLVASANYLLNEWLDSTYDKHHPLKSNRPFVKRKPKAATLLLAYSIFAGTGLLISVWINLSVAWVQFALLLSGLIYNVRPIRSKDIPFVDVLTESLNNPLRFLIGWTLVTDTLIPPSSVLIAYWMGGAFLMGIKRYAEYKTVESMQGKEVLVAYRKVFKVYNGDRLLVSSFFYALLSAFTMAVFLTKYRIEYLLLFPVISALFASYLRIALKPASGAQAPEKLIREKTLWVIIFVLLILFIFCSFVDIPQLHILIDPYIGI